MKIITELLRFAYILIRLELREMEDAFELGFYKCPGHGRVFESSGVLARGEVG